MLDKFISLFRGQVREAIVSGSKQGLDDANLRHQVRCAVADGVRDALSHLHELLEERDAVTPEPLTNGRSRKSRVHA